YGTLDKPAFDQILRKLKTLAKEQELSSVGLGRRTLYEVLKMEREK
ncbi:hypothetical protein CR082_25575, partial [Salmonella enterica subsp. enterica serovar Typhimurium]